MQHRKHISIIAIFAAILLTGWIMPASGAKPTSWDVDANTRKADYIFMRALGSLALDSIDVGMRQMRRAAEMNPADGELRAQLAMAQLSYGPSDNDSIIAVLYGPMIDEFHANPSDYTGAVLTANVAEHLKRFDDLIEIYHTLDSLFPAKTAPAAALATAYLTRYIAKNDTADFNRSINILNRLERGTGKDLGLTSQKVRAYALRHDTTAIINELNTLQEALPTEPRAFLLSASIYSALHIDSLVLPNLQKTCAIDSTFGQGLMALADYYRTAADSVAYDSTVFRVLKSPDVEFESKYRIMRTYVATMFNDKTQWPRIQNLFSILQQVNPGEPAVHELYGSFEISRKENTAAAEQFAFALALNPQDDQVRSYTIQALFACVDDGNTALNDSIIAVARKGMDLSPNNLYFPIIAAVTLNECGKANDAVALLKSVDVSEASNKQAVSNLLTTLGDMYYRAELPDSAFAQYGRALDLYPDNFMAANNYAYFLSQHNRDLDKALELSRKAVLSEPENPTYLDTYAWVYFKQKNYTEAKAQIDHALECYFAAPDSVVVSDSISDENDSHVDNYSSDNLINEEPTADIYEHAGDIYFMCGEPKKALEFWEKALALDPKNALLAKKVKYKAYYYE